MSDAQLVAAAAYNRAMADREPVDGNARKKAVREARSRRDLWLQLADEIDAYLAGRHEQGALL